MCESHAVDSSEHYRQLLQLGREEFLASAAPAALVRYRKEGDELPSYSGMRTLTMDEDSEQDARGEYITEETMPFGKDLPQTVELEVYPLAKKSGASFPDRITIGRTSNNDVVISEHSVSRLHAYVREADGWVVADAGSKNGSWIGDFALEPRREFALPSGTVLRLGDVRLTFYPAAALFDLHGGDHGGR